MKIITAFQKIVALLLVMNAFLACSSDKASESNDQGTTDPAIEDSLAQVKGDSILWSQLDAKQQEQLENVFATPTKAEKDSLLESYFGTQDVDAVEPKIVTRDTLNGRIIWIVQHKSDSLKHYGAVVFPKTASDLDSLPVLLFCHWGDDGLDVGKDVDKVLTYVSGIAENFVVVIPSFRSESVSLNDSVWVSEGDPSPWKFDVLDGLRLVSSAESLSVKEGKPLISTGVRESIGFSRGGGVALLAALHDSRYQRVVDFFGPTDFFGRFVKNSMVSLMLGDEIDLPGAEFLDTTLVEGLKTGKLSIADVRNELLMRSPAQFAEELPPVQIQHGDADKTVPVSQAYALQNALKANAPETYAKSEVIIHPAGGHSPLLVLAGSGDAQNFLLGGFGLKKSLAKITSLPYEWTPVKAFPQ